MAQKWNLQDIRPGGNARPARKSTRAASVEQKQAPSVDAVAEQPRVEEAAPAARPRTYQQAPMRLNTTSNKKRWVLVAGAVVFFIVAGTLISTLFGGAEVTVYPKNRTTTVQSNFTAYIEPQADQLGYELLTLEASGERQVTASGQEEASERAVGTITIYNEFSTSPQRLIKNTRFESPDGLVFRIEESVEVPGYTEDAEGNTVPGTITAEVFADATGEEYNLLATEFTIPGLEGTDQYDDMYARSTSPFTGGFEGLRYVIDDAELMNAQNSLHEELRNALLSRLETERPAGFIVYDDAITFAYDSLPATEYGDNLATIKEQARLQVPIWNEAAFASHIAQNTLVGYEGEAVYLEDPSTLSFSFASGTPDDLATANSLGFSLSGNTRIVWHFDAAQLKADLMGMSKTALHTVLSGYPAIERAEAVIKPFWKQSFPEDAEKITVTTVLEAAE